MDFLLPLGVFEKHCIHLRNDSELDLDKIRKELVRLGYESTFQVESTGQFSVRGGILDIYPLTEQNPIRRKRRVSAMRQRKSAIRSARAKFCRERSSIFIIFIRRPSRFLSICRRTAAFSSMSRTASSSVPMRWNQNFRRA